METACGWNGVGHCDTFQGLGNVLLCEELDLLDDHMIYILVWISFSEALQRFLEASSKCS